MNRERQDHVKSFSNVKAYYASLSKFLNGLFSFTKQQSQQVISKMDLKETMLFSYAAFLNIHYVQSIPLVKVIQFSF